MTQITIWADQRRTKKQQGYSIRFKQDGAEIQYEVITPFGSSWCQGTFYGSPAEFVRQKQKVLARLNLEYGIGSLNWRDIHDQTWRARNEQQ